MNRLLNEEVTGVEIIFVIHFPGLFIISKQHFSNKIINHENNYGGLVYGGPGKIELKGNHESIRSIRKCRERKKQ